MYAECYYCHTRLDEARRDRTYGVRAWNPLRMEWVVDCPACGGILILVEDEDEDYEDYDD